MTIQQMLSEELSDISTSSELYHYTNIKNLLSILEDGYLEGQNYPTKATKNNSHYTEIATMRKAKESELQKTNKWNAISGGIGKIKFILYKDRINTLRNTSIKPIAEFPKSRINQYKMKEKYLLDFLIEKGFQKEIIKNDLKDLKKGNQTALDKYIEDYDKIKEDKDRRSIKFTKEDLLFDAKYINKFSHPEYREGEERIIRKDGNRNIIPLKKEYLKIVLEKGAVKEFNSFRTMFNIGKITKFLKNIISKKELFVIDDEYHNMVTTLRNYIKSNNTNVN